MVEILLIGFTDAYTGSGTTKNGFLMGAIGDVITATIGISVHWESLQVLVAFDSAAKTIERRDNRSWTESKFQQGDTFTIVGSVSNAGNYTIASISQDGSIITTVETLVTEIASGVDFHGTTPVSAFDFYFNTPMNQGVNNDFSSLVDTNNIQKQSANKPVWNDGDIVNLSANTISKAWITDTTDTITKISTTNYAQIFTIVNTFVITPYFLNSQQSLFSPLTYPPYFANGSSLKYILRADAKFSVNSPAVVHTTSTSYNFQLGNVGWFNEFLNGGTPDYALVSVSYADIVTSLPVTSPDLQNDTVVTMILNSAAGNFGAGSKINLQMIYCPLDLVDYINTKTNQKQNFRLDSQMLIVGAGAVNGVNYGTDYQSIKTITAILNSANQVTITFTISLSAVTKTILKNKSDSNRKFLFWATPQKLASTYLGDTDRNAVLGDFNNYAYNQDDTTLLIFQDVLFYQYPDITTNGYTNYSGFIGDQVLVNSKFIIDNGATPLDFTAQVMAVNSVTGESFELSKYTQQFPADELNGKICSDITPTLLNYKLPQQDPRNQVFLNRNVALDTSSAFGYEFSQGFVLRYETWRDAPNFTSAFSCTHTQDWSIYALMPNWALKYAVTINVTKSGHITQFIHYADIIAKDDTFSDDGFGGLITPTVQTFYTDSQNNLMSANGIIQNDQNTHVRISFASTGSSFVSLPPNAIGYYGYIALDVEDIGGEFLRDITTTESEPLDDSAWIASVLITTSDTRIDLEADIDFTKLDLKNKTYLITGRFGFKY